MNVHKLSQIELAFELGIGVSTLYRQQQMPGDCQDIGYRYAVAALAADLKPIDNALLAHTDLEPLFKLIGLGCRTMYRYRKSGPVRRWLQYAAAAVAAGLPPVKRLPDAQAYNPHDHPRRDQLRHGAY
jgi:hypothetical protein